MRHIYPYYLNMLVLVAHARHLLNFTQSKNLEISTDIPAVFINRKIQNTPTLDCQKQAYSSSMGIGILLLLCLLTACTSEFHHPRVNQLGYLPVGDDANVVISVNQGINTNEFRKLLYVQVEMHGTMQWYAYQDYIMEAFRQLDFFDHVMTRQPTVHINTTPPRPTTISEDDKVWFDVTDTTPMRTLTQQYGHDFMVAKATLRDAAPTYNDTGGYFFELKLIEARTGKVVFQGSKEGKNKFALDRNVINPVLNYAQGYLLYYDPTYVPEHPPTRTLADWVETFTYQATPIWE